MSETIPTEARAALRAELNADSPEYRDGKPDASEWVKANRGPSPLLSLRIPADVLEHLTVAAATVGVPVSALVRGYILEGLTAHEGDTVRTIAERMARDAQALSALTA